MSESDTTPLVPGWVVGIVRHPGSNDVIFNLTMVLSVSDIADGGSAQILKSDSSWRNTVNSYILTITEELKHYRLINQPSYYVLSVYFIPASPEVEPILNVRMTTQQRSLLPYDKRMEVIRLSSQVEGGIHIATPRVTNGEAMEPFFELFKQAGNRQEAQPLRSYVELLGVCHHVEGSETDEYVPGWEGDLKPALFDSSKVSDGHRHWIRVRVLSLLGYYADDSEALGLGRPSRALALRVPLAYFQHNASHSRWEFFEINFDRVVEVRLDDLES